MLWFLSFLWWDELISLSERIVSHIFIKYLMKLLANKDFLASFKWSFFLPYNFWSFLFELSIKASLFALQYCLIVSFPRFTFALMLLLSWRRIMEDRTIFVDGDGLVTKSSILLMVIWRLEQSSFVMSFVPMCRRGLLISLLRKVLLGIYV